jgi:hypothetical protein
MIQFSACTLFDPWHGDWVVVGVVGVCLIFLGGMVIAKSRIGSNWRISRLATQILLYVACQ